MVNVSFVIGGKTINSRLFVGTGKLPSYEMIKDIIREAQIDVVTVAVRRAHRGGERENILDYIPKETIIMVNTSGARDYKEAVKIALIGRELTNSNWIKVEIEADTKYLLPDNEETIKACEILVKEGFNVFPYISPDLIVAKKLEDIGVSAVMPLGSPIGTNKGLVAKELLKAIINEVKIPVIVDAGIGRPSHAAEAMELGAEACLINTAIATAKDPIKMAKAFKMAIDAGRLACEVGVLKEREYADASSPLTGFLRGV
ncbi:thiazole synthase [Caloramator sp. CAR-1]|uniref:thiazole synthase n=1 Tax=Caloramator sp. CAR-1 TaxID=3062777 RepID=UPI00237D6E6B|nr:MULTISPECIES: thiazole synthase [unclassified Caloramator]MDO6354830.1 thiazole synthase [Caloramator sp. CAR-1]WDU84661.1 thiazole synthase [Caloramator sp. Dgby_cultured_2]